MKTLEDKRRNASKQHLNEVREPLDRLSKIKQKRAKNSAKSSDQIKEYNGIKIS